MGIIFQPPPAEETVDTFISIKPIGGELEPWTLFSKWFYVRTDVDYAKGKGLVPPPRKLEPWTFGIVQNVLFHRIAVQYTAQERIEMQWTAPVVDCNSKEAYPYYGLSSPEPISPPGENQATSAHEVYVRPKVFAFYGPDGLAVHEPPALQPSPVLRIPVGFPDRPRITVPQQRSGKPLRWVLTQGIFQFWIVGQGPDGKFHMLGHVDPFTLVSWAEFEETGMKSRATAVKNWDSYFYARPIVDFKRTRPDGNDRLKLKTGPSREKMVVTGPTANERGNAWMKKAVWNR